MGKLTIKENHTKGLVETPDKSEAIRAFIERKKARREVGVGDKATEPRYHCLPNCACNARVFSDFTVPPQDLRNFRIAVSIPEHCAARPQGSSNEELVARVSVTLAKPNNSGGRKHRECALLYTPSFAEDKA